ncbi:MAG: TonB-dependent receptor [Chitinophagaceae bacterium]|nr:TonB-dependent receptor [Chitinophagaceae bacterium]
MKLTAIFLIVVCLQASATGYSQSDISISVKNVELKKLFNILQRQTDYRFLYEDAQLPKDTRINLDVKKASIQAVLNTVLSNTSLRYRIMNDNLVVLSAASREFSSYTVKGRITDENGQPLQGVTISIKGSSSGVSTAADGTFSIEAPENSVLEISFIGYINQEVTVRNNDTINLQLAPADKSMEEVVVVGYGTVKRKDLTGAVASVNGKDLQANIAKSAAGALQGRVAGVTVSNMGGQPGSGMSINIRGLSSLGSNTPLYVIDGVYSDISLIDPVDIASIEILKDASAAAIYGSRAANGVVLITTKGGRKSSPTVISVNAYTGVQSVTKKLDVMNAQQWKNIMKESGYLPQEALDFQGNGTNWQDEIYRTAPVSKINVDVSGGGERSTYSLSAGYLDQKGILLNTGYKAFNIRSKNTFGFFKNHLRVGNTLLLRSGDRQYSDFTITDALRQNPMIPVLDADQLGGYAPFAPWMKNLDNPVGYLKLHNWHTYQTDILVNAYAEVDLGLRGLKYKFNLGINRTNGRNYNYNDAYNFGSGLVKSYLGENAFFNNQWLAENTLHYDNSFNKHTISFLAGYSAQENSNRGFGLSRRDIPYGTNVIDAGSPTEQNTNGSLQESSLVSMFSRLMYSYDSRYLFTASIRRDGSSRFAPGHRYGVFPSVAVGWNIANEKFFETAKTSINELKLRASYGKLGNQEIGNYSTQSIVTSGINYLQGSGSNESWWQGASTGVNWVSPQNLTWEETRTSNIGLDAAFLNNKLSLSADYYVRETRNILLGINMPPSAGLGGTPTMNAGTIENKGFELLVNYRGSAGKVNYNIGVNASTVRNRVKAVTVGNIQEFGGYNPQGEGTITWAKVDYPIGGFWVIKTDGLFQSDAEAQGYKNPGGDVIQPDAKAGDIKFVDFNNDGKISEDDRQYVGSPFPKMAYGIRGGLEYSGFDFSFFFDGMYGNKIYNYTRARMESTNEIINFSTDLLNSWTSSNTNTSIPRFTPQDKNMNWRRVSERWIEDGAFFRLRTLELGYTIQSSLKSKATIRSGRIYVAGENLFTITKYKGYTPDLGQNNGQNGGGSGTLTAGTDHGRFPLARTIIVGLQVSF